MQWILSQDTWACDSSQPYLREQKRSSKIPPLAVHCLILVRRYPGRLCEIICRLPRTGVDWLPKTDCARHDWLNVGNRMRP
jgi:hypothetical protein